MLSQSPRWLTLPGHHWPSKCKPPVSLPGKRWLNSFKSPGIEEFPDISRTLWTLQSTSLYFAYELNIIFKNYFLLQIRHSDGPALSTVVMLSTTAALRALGHTGTVFTGLRDISTPVQYIIFFSPLLQVFCHGCKFLKERSLWSWGTVHWTAFRFLKMGTMLPVRYIFISPIPKNRLILPRARQSFHFQKIQGPWKSIFCF